MLNGYQDAMRAPATACVETQPSSLLCLKASKIVDKKPYNIGRKTRGKPCSAMPLSCKLVNYVDSSEETFVDLSCYAYYFRHCEIYFYDVPIFRVKLSEFTISAIPSLLIVGLLW
jgi:hypothetical protein